MNRNELIEECVRLRTITRCYDARNCTSFEEEIACLLRNHQPFVHMSTEELENEYSDAWDAVGELNGTLL